MHINNDSSSMWCCGIFTNWKKCSRERKMCKGEPVTWGNSETFNPTFSCPFSPSLPVFALPPLPRPYINAGEKGSILRCTPKMQLSGSLSPTGCGGGLGGGGGAINQSFKRKRIH